MEMVKKVKKCQREKVLFGILYIVSFFVMGFALGVLPFGELLTNGLMYTFIGQTNVSNLESIFAFNYLNQYIPYGMRLTEAFGVYYLVHLVALTGVSEVVACQIITFLFYIGSYISLLFVAIKLTKSRFAGWVITVVFFMNPLMVSQQGVPPLYIGILFMPVLLLQLYKFNQFVTNKLMNTQISSEKNKRDWQYIITNFIVFLVMASTSWYLAIICASGVCLYFLIYYLTYIKKQKFGKLVQIFFVYTIIPWIGALGLILLITPSSVASTETAFDFMNGSSIDVLTMLLPSENQLVGHFFSIQSVIPENEYIPGNGVQYYLGYTVIILLIVGIVWKKGRNRSGVALALSGLVLLILSLGPGLRVACTLDKDMLTEIGQYRLPLENDIFLFPWAKLFMMFPLNIMRAVYRWYIGAVFLFIILAAITLGKIKQNYKYGLIVSNILCVCLLIEFLPCRISHEGVEDYKIFKQVQADCVEELQGIFEGEDNTLVFCSYDYNTNTYLIPMIMSELDNCKTYSGAGDKARGMATMYQPKSVLNCTRSTDAETIAVNISKIAETKLANYVILPYFDLSNAVYSWPADEKTVIETKLIAEQVAEQLDGRYDIIYLQHYMVVDLNNANEENLCVYATKESENAKFMLEDEGFGSKYAIDMKSASFKQEVSDDDDTLYVWSILKGKNEKIINYHIEYYDENENLIDSDVVIINELEDYTSSEFTLELPNGTKYIKYDFYNDTDGESYLKRMFSTSYNSEDIIKTEEVKKTEEMVGLIVDELENICIQDNSLIFSQDSVLCLRDNKIATGQKIEIQMEVYLDNENAQNTEMFNKWVEWQDNMTFALAYHEDDERYYFNVSNDGCEVYGCGWGLDDMPKDMWNSLKITFEKGHLMVKVNEKIIIDEECGFETLYVSSEPIQMGNGMVGRIRNFKYDAN